MTLVFVFFSVVVGSEYKPTLTRYLSFWIPMVVVYVGLFFVFGPKRK
jgi:hypothetical protein